MPRTAAGIPDREDYGDLSQLQAGQLVHWLVNRHIADRAGDHRDIRLGTPETGLFSWASRKDLPQPGQKTLAVRQPLHSWEQKDFQGKIESGYGKGNVSKQDEGRVLITKIEPGKVHFTLAHKRYPERFVLVRPSGTTGVASKSNNWLLLNTTPTTPLQFKKEHYKSIPADKIEPFLANLAPGSSVQAKVDGALTLTKLLKDKIELLSYRQSKVHGGPLPHTERVFHREPNIQIPKQYVGSVLQGELYGQQNNQSIPPQALGGILNSSVGKSLDTQANQNIKLKQMLFDIQQLGKKKLDFNTTPYAERMSHIQNILGSIKGPDSKLIHDTINTPAEAKTPKDALKLYKEIASGQHPATEEGIVVHPPQGKPIKSKLFDEDDVYVRGVFPGKGRLQNSGAGGFVYSHTKNGPIAGEIGTGMSEALRKDLFENSADYVGRVARIRHTGQLSSGALFQPSLLSFHEDY